MLLLATQLTAKLFLFRIGLLPIYKHHFVLHNVFLDEIRATAVVRVLNVLTVRTYCTTQRPLRLLVISVSEALFFLLYVPFYYDH